MFFSTFDWSISVDAVFCSTCDAPRLLFWLSLLFLTIKGVGRDKEMAELWFVLVFHSRCWKKSWFGQDRLGSLPDFQKQVSWWTWLVRAGSPSTFLLYKTQSQLGTGSIKKWNIFISIWQEKIQLENASSTFWKRISLWSPLFGTLG